MLSEQNRSAYSDSELDKILSEFAHKPEQASVSGESVRDMARRYQINASINFSSSSAYPPDGFVWDTDYEPNNTPRSRKDTNAPIYDEKGQRIVYDADMQNSATEENDSTSQPGVHVVYDAQTSAVTAYEAPFSDFSELKTKKDTDNADKSKKKKNGDKQVVKQQETSKIKRIFRVFLPWKGDSGAEKVRKLVMDTSFIILLVCSVLVVNYFIELSDSLKTTGDLSDLVTTSPQQAMSSEEEKWAKIRAKYPNVNFPEGMLSQFAELYVRNNEFVGWLSIDNTNIDTAIVQKVSDPNEYYLTHDFANRETKYGNTFMDFRNDIKELDQNTIIYGHHMKDGLMFAQLANYMTIDGFKASPLIVFTSLYQKYYWKVYAVFITNGSIKDDNGYLFNYIVPNFISEQNYADFIKALDERKLYSTGVDINSKDKILTLSTCSYEFNNARLAVVARLVRTGESTAVDTSLARVNENIRYPQKWYDVNGLTNPFADAFQWQP